MQNLIIKVTDQKTKLPILIGVESIISVIPSSYEDSKSEIKSRGAMIETVRVVETVDEIYNLINS